MLDSNPLAAMHLNWGRLFAETTRLLDTATGGERQRLLTVAKLLTRISEELVALSRESRWGTGPPA